MNVPEGWPNECLLVWKHRTLATSLASATDSKMTKQGLTCCSRLRRNHHRSTAYKDNRIYTLLSFFRKNTTNLATVDGFESDKSYP